MLLRTKTLAYVVLAPKKAHPKYTKQIKKSALIRVNLRLKKSSPRLPRQPMDKVNKLRRCSHHKQLLTSAIQRFSKTATVKPLPSCLKAHLCPSVKSVAKNNLRQSALIRVHLWLLFIESLCSLCPLWLNFFLDFCLKFGIIPTMFALVRHSLVRRRKQANANTASRRKSQRKNRTS